VWSKSKRQLLAVVSDMGRLVALDFKFHRPRPLILNEELYIYLIHLLPFYVLCEIERIKGDSYVKIKYV